MPIKGAIQADYSAYVAECAKAAAGLAAIESQGKATEQSLTAMEKSVSDGGISKGIESTVRSVDKAANSARAAQTGFGQMSDGLRNADKVLSQFGLNLGPTIGSLDEFAQMSGKTATQLGVLGTAAGVAGAAMAGWQIGRFIAELTGSDQAIANVINRLRGLDQQGAINANNADVLARAYAVTGKVFTDVHLASEALRAASASNAAQFTTTASLVSKWTAELQHARGGLAALNGEITAGNMTTEQMRIRFQVSAEAIDYQRRMLALATDETAKKAAADERAAAEAQKHADAIKRLQDAMFGTDTIAKAGEYVTALGGVENLTRMSREQQLQLNTALGAAIDAYGRLGQVAPQAMRDIYTATLPLPPIVAGLGSEFANVGEKVSVSADGIIADLKAAQQSTVDYEAETQRLADEFNKTQAATYGAKAATDAYTGSTSAATAATVQMNAALGRNRTMLESVAAGYELMQAYQRTGVAMGTQIAAGGYNFQRMQESGHPGYNLAPGLGPPAIATGAWAQPWGNQNTLTVNVNNANADQIAQKLATEMRHSGIRM